MRKTWLDDKRFGRWTVIRHLAVNHAKCVCVCDCGTVREVYASHLRRGKSESCGCLMREKATKDISGMRFGRLTAVEQAESISGRVAWLCECDCGNWIVVRKSSLCNTGTSSCGCVRKDLPKMSDHPRWKSGTFVGKNGYIYTYVGDNKYRLEHRLVVERRIGRALDRSEIVHHIDGDKKNNADSNLELLQSQKEHMQIHAGMVTA